MVKLTKEELKEAVEVLSEKRGRHTELISVYISEGYDVNSVQKQLEAEKATAKNIKSPATRKNVIDALEKIVRYLKSLKETPENGLAIFAGNVSKTEGQQDLQLWEIEPQKPLNTRLYRCDKEFVLEPLEKMLEVDEVFGLLVLDRKEATIGLLEGKRIDILHNMTSGIPSKVRAGGQSSQRFHRITEGLTKDFYKRIAEQMKKSFFGMKKLKGIIVGGPIPTKDEFLDGDYLMTQLKEKVIGKIDIGDTSESGLEELVEKSQELLANHERVQEKQEIEELFKNLGEKKEETFLDEKEIRRALELGAVHKLFISEDISKDKTKELVKMAKNISAEVKIISDETSEGRQFQNLGGIAAILRYRV